MRSLLHTFLLLSLSCILFVAPAFSQSGAAAPKARLITTLPMHQFVDGVIMVRAMLDTFPDTLRFILDTGSGGIAIDSTTCDSLKLKVSPSDKIIRGIGGSSKLFYALNHTLKLPGLTVDSLNFHVTNYDLISALYGVHIDGIIGYSFLKQFIVSLNFDKMQINIYTPGEFKYSRGGELLKPLLVGIPVVEAPLKNKIEVNSRYFFDTGAGLSLLLTNQFVNDNKLLQRKRHRHRALRTTEAQGLMGKMEMKLTTMQELTVGGYSFHLVPTLLFDDVSNVTSYPFLGGIIGNEIWRRFNIVLNYPHKEIHIIPNSHFRDRFDYSYTGLAIYEIDGKVQVTNVISGSPAQKAGLQPGDIIIAIDNVFGNDIQKDLQMLKDIGSRVRLIILRDDKLDIKYLSIKSFL